MVAASANVHAALVRSPVTALEGNEEFLGRCVTQSRSRYLAASEQWLPMGTFICIHHTHSQWVDSAVYPCATAPATNADPYSLRFSWWGQSTNISRVTIQVTSDVLVTRVTCLPGFLWRTWLSFQSLYLHLMDLFQFILTLLMGLQWVPPSPAIASLFMETFEYIVLEPSWFLRYVDDTFVIWPLV